MSRRTRLIRAKTIEPCDMPRHSAAHLLWRLDKGVHEDATPGWFLFDGRQIATIVSGLRLLETANR